jgi:sulfur carrier protein
MTITLFINSQATDLPTDCSLDTALAITGHDQPYCAVAVNKTFVPKSQYPHTVLQKGDSVEVLAPMQGG